MEYQCEDFYKKQGKERNEKEEDGGREREWENKEHQ